MLGRRPGTLVCLLAALCLMFGSRAALASATPLEMGEHPLDPTPYSEFLIDASGDMDLQQITRLDDSAWQPATSSYHFGFSQASHWVRFQLSNSTADTSHAVLSIDYPLLRYLNVYVLHQGDLTQQFAAGIGQSNAYAQLERFPNPAVLLTVEPKGITEVFIQFHSDGSLQLPLTLWPEADYLYDSACKTLLYGVFFGLLLMLGLYSLFNSVAMRSSVHLVFAAYVLTSSLLMMELIGLRQAFGGAGGEWLQESTLPFLILVTLMMALLLSERLIGLRRLHRRLLVSIRSSLILVVAALLVVPFLDYQLGVGIAAALLGPLSLLMVAGGAMLAWRGNRMGAFYAIARAAMLSGALLGALSYYGYLSWDVSSHTPYLVGVLIEGILLAMTMAMQVAQQRREREDARQESLEQARRVRLVQDKLVQLKDEAKSDLEHKVQERTFELEVALRELAEANRILEERNTTDFLTGVKNRQHFDKRYVAELRRSRREHTPLSLVMMDIDHFKRVNDTHGHMVGDECLRTVAKLIADQLKRPADIVTRFGGEEFALILPNTPHQGALQVAEAIRAAVASNQINIQQVSLQVTVSLGVATMQLKSDSHQQKLLEEADKALYQAKQEGRNRVVGVELESESNSINE